MSTLLRPKDLESYHSDGKDTSMPKEYIQVKPRRELNFIRQKNKYTAEITLINTNYDPVIFKVRTTAAKSYVVSPTIGLIHPRATTIIQIFMPTKEEIRDRANDKFLVQAFPYAGDIEEEDQIQEIFNLFAKSMSSQGFQNTKLKVHFEVNSAIKEVHSEESTPVVKQKSRSSSLMRNNNDFTAYHNNKDDSQPTSLYEEIEIYNKSRLLSSPDPKGSYPEQGSNQLSLKDIGSKNILTSSPEQGPTISANPSLDNIPKADLRNNNLNNSMANMKQTWKTSSEKEDSRYLSYISAPRMRTGTGSSDVSGFTDFTDFKSAKGDTNTLLMYKAKCLTLEQKYRQQKKLLAQMTEEKESYLSKTNALKLASIAGPIDDHEFKHVSKGGQIELWHILVVSIIFLILGSLLK